MLWESAHCVNHELHQGSIQGSFKTVPFSYQLLYNWLVSIMQVSIKDYHVGTMHTICLLYRHGWKMLWNQCGPIISYRILKCQMMRGSSYVVSIWVHQGAVQEVRECDVNGHCYVCDVLFCQVPWSVEQTQLCHSHLLFGAHLFLQDIVDHKN